MTRLHIGSLLLPVALGIILLVALFVATDLDLAAIKRLLVGVHPLPLAEIVLLMAFNSFLAGEKWRLVVLNLHRVDGDDIPRPLYFALSAIGVALGQVLPIQLSTALCRWLGSRAYGGYTLTRGVGATLFEQLFDLLVAGLLAFVSIVVISTGSSAAVWFAGAAIMIVAGFTLCEIAAPLAARVSPLFGPKRADRGKFAQLLSTAGTSRLLHPRVTRRLFLLSVFRFAILVLVSAASADAVSLDIPLWHLAAAFPFGMFATALALTPGGIGVGEWGLSSALFAVGTPLQVGAQWAITCRILVVIATFVCAAAALLLVGVVRSLGARGVVMERHDP